MYRIEIRLKQFGWICSDFQVEERCILSVHIIAFEDVRRRSESTVTTFLPLGDMEYLIWGQTGCLGLVTISELSQKVHTPDLEDEV